MKKNTAFDRLSATAPVAAHDPRPSIPLFADQRTETTKKIKDPSSTCFTSCRYPIPSFFPNRVQSRD